MKKKLSLMLVVAGAAFLPGVTFAELDIHNEPLFIGVSIPPAVMLNMSSDNQLFFNAYPEYADLTGNGEPELGYTHEFDYFGYFDSFKCYTITTPIITSSRRRSRPTNTATAFPGTGAVTFSTG